MRSRLDPSEEIEPRGSSLEDLFVPSILHRDEDVIRSAVNFREKYAARGSKIRARRSVRARVGRASFRAERTDPECDYRFRRRFLVPTGSSR